MPFFASVSQTPLDVVASRASHCRQAGALGTTNVGRSTGIVAVSVVVLDSRRSWIVDKSTAAVCLYSDWATGNRRASARDSELKLSS